MNFTHTHRTPYSIKWESVVFSSQPAVGQPREFRCVQIATCHTTAFFNYNLVEKSDQEDF